MKLTKQALLVSIAVVFCLALKAQKAFGQELLSYDSYFETLTAVSSDIDTGPIKPKRNNAVVSKFHDGEGQYLDFTIEEVFDGEYEIKQGSDIDMSVKSRNAFANSVQYEATGNIFGQKFDFMTPIIIEKNVFGSRQTLNVSGTGMNLSFEQRSGWDQMDIAATMSGLKPETITVLIGLIDFLPDLDFTRGLSDKAKLANKSKNDNLSFCLRKSGGDMVYADGGGVNLRIQTKKYGRDDTEYEIMGSAFGMEFGFEDFIIRTDESFLGRGGYRVLAAQGIDIEVKRDNFGLRGERIKITGYAGKSAELTAFLLGFTQYIMR
ncbi:MAG: hypothetical protein L6416_06920 [Candidatus Omnitrophica bacterium]|nr:hypothetical protein [Candidatus Omnitrophota bacterium]